METTENIAGAACGGTARDRKNQRRIIAWSLAWMLTWLGVNFAVSFDLLATGALATVAGLATGLLGLATIFAYRRFLREADELRRKIEVDALALALGVGLVGGMTYWLLGRTGGVAEVDLLWVMTAMMATYGLGVFIGWRRYA